MNNGLSSLNPLTPHSAVHSHLDAFAFLHAPVLWQSDSCLYQTRWPITSSLPFCELRRGVQEHGLSSSNYIYDHGGRFMQVDMKVPPLCCWLWQGVEPLSLWSLCFGGDPPGDNLLICRSAGLQNCSGYAPAEEERHCRLILGDGF